MIKPNVKNELFKLPSESNIHKHHLTFIFRWDGQYFLHIADNGYTYENTLAFFPVYPSFVRILAEAIYWAQVEYSLIHFMSALKISAIFFAAFFMILRCRRQKFCGPAKL